MKLRTRATTVIAAAASLVTATVAVVGVTGVAHAFPQQFPVRNAEYVAMGDSYAAVGALSKTSPADNICFRASDNPGNLVNRNMRFKSFADNACAGAIGAEIFGNGLHGPQAISVGPATRYISISIGGNDLGIADVAHACLFPSPSQYESKFCLRSGPGILNAGLARMSAVLDRVYPELRRRAPHAKIVTVGYLRPTPKVRSASCLATMLMGQPELGFFNQAEDRINGLIAAKSKQYGLTMVNQFTPPGHDMCSPAGPGRWVSFIGYTDSAEPLHPTAAGQAYVASQIEAAFRR